MKLNLKLGVPTEALLKHPTTCFRLSKAATRISDALSFSEFYVKQAEAAHAPFFSKRDIEHISAGFWQSSKSAQDLSALVDDQQLRKDIQVYAKTASRINTMIRQVLKKADKSKPVSLHVSQVVNKAASLRKKIEEINKKVENLCTVDTPAAPSPTPAPIAISGRGRVMMAGSGGIIHKKKPMYPRYFVASMGRSRR